MLTLSLTLLLTQLPSGSDLLQMSLEEQRAKVSELSVEERTELVKSLSIDELLALEKRAALASGTYHAQVMRSERVKGSLTPQETMSVWVQPEPLAIRLESIGGPPKGRKVVYNSTLRKDELRAKDSGFLGVFGGVWLNLDSSMTRSDSNHPLTDLGFIPVMNLVEKIVKQTRAKGEITRTYVRTDATGVCERFDAPKGAKGLYATSSLLCFDPVLSLPMHFEISDDQGRLETYTYSNVEQHVSLAKAFFTPEAAGL
jgi:hypothetical protein